MTKTTLSFDALELDVLRVELDNRADALRRLLVNQENDQGVQGEDELDELELVKRLLRRVEAAARRLRKKQA